MKAFIALILILLGGASGFFYYVSETYYKQPMGDGSVVVIFEVQQGESFASVSRRLEDQKLIHNQKLLNQLARFYGLRSKIRSGEYGLNNGLSPKEILDILVTGKSLTYPFTVSEGLNSYEIAINFEKKGYGPRTEFLAACSDKALLEKILNEKISHCEGYLFPETYNFEKKTTAHVMVETMLKATVKNYQEIAKGRNLGGWSRHQIVTFASLIEKETGAPEERPMIASVFFNRLQKSMRLQTDPTVQYGVLATTGVYPMNITKKDLTTPTPYNTYLKEGLPPGPISNPGKESMKAVFEPQKSDYLFFVSQNNGTHVFTKTYEEHLKAVKDFQLNAKAREGKSWRDLQK